ncbi:MAG: glycoside hydrolase family 16 protein [Clostridia bacterium]|nr:glycoside hydrolase family 16 protein [Clostridia bacterium]
MLFKKITIVSLCIVLSLCTTACRKTDGNLSSNYSNVSIVTDVYNEGEIDTGSENTTASEITQGSEISNTSSDNTPSTKEEVTVNMKEKYGFNTLKSVEYYCVKDIPYGDAEYEITAILTDTGSNIGYMGDISCKTKGVTVDGKKVTIPYDYKINNKSITLTATHRPSGVSIDFNITFDTWEMIFEDEFNGTELNTDVWNVWDSADWQYFYSPDSMFLDGNGHLINRVSILETPDSEFGYTRKSGAITTKDKYEHTYGYFEISMKPHRTNGMMGAFWIMAGDMGDKDAANDNSSVNGAEIDVVETLYNTKIPSHAVHWDGYTNTKSYGGTGKLQPIPEVFDGNFHTFAVRWTPDEYVFLVDGKVTARTEAEGGCNQPGYMLISTHFNEDWVGKVTMQPGEHTDMIVDYVRVYKNSSDPK